jgi:hypothetical protein
MSKITSNLTNLENFAVDNSPTKNRNIGCHMITKEVNGYPQNIITTILDLKSVIDQYHTNSKNAKDLILELAKALDEERLCEKSQICRKIKEVLEDKIKEGKISEKWIEECLPQDYKRKYTKSEVSSLSKDYKTKAEHLEKAESSETRSDGRESDNNCFPPSKENILIPVSSSHNSEGSENNNVISCTRCQELEEALLKASPTTHAVCATKAEISFVIPEEKYHEVLGVILCGYDCCYLTFDRFSGVLLRAEVREGQSDEGK